LFAALLLAILAKQYFMKPTKTFFSNIPMFAFLISALIITSCHKDESAIDNSSSSTGTISAERYSGNKAPVIKTGADQSYTTAVASITLDGSGSYDPDGTISTYAWTKDFGTGGTITSASSAKTTVTGLTTGVYRFKLTITDNNGSSISDTIRITNGSGATAPPSGNQAPVVNAGPNKTVISPATSVTLSGSATDADGTIASYLWTKVSGTGSIITTPNAATTTITGLTAGSYVFNLKATDNGGASGNKTVTVTVSTGTPPPNQLPVITIGSAQTITLPTSSVNLTGSATDADGTIASYLWTKVSGTGGTISNPNSASTSVTGLTAGAYVFNLKATDNAGGSSNKTVAVTVNAATGGGGSTGYTLVYSTGYNTQADLDPFDHGQIGNGGLSTNVYVTGPGSFHSRPNNVSAGIRSEVQYDAAQSPLEGAVEYDVLYNVIVPNNGHSLQWHPTTSGGSASPGLWFVNGKFQWNNWKDGQNANHTTGITVQTGHWYHMRIEYKFGSAGYLRHYIDGTLVCSWTGQVGDGSAPYLKVGYNGWDSNSTASDINYDNLQVFKKQ
jgi:PKD domain/Polysaccharide lyase